VAGLVSLSEWATLEAPLSNARIHVADLLPPCVPTTIYLNSSVLVADVYSLQDTPARSLRGHRTQYYHAN
jgi:hypothetical protein